MTRPLTGLDGWTVRGCTLRDVAAILAITRASDMAALGEPDWSEDEVVETLTAPAEDPSVDTWLAAGPDGVPVAWAYVDNPKRGDRDNVELYAWPGRGEPAYGPLLDLAVARAVERSRGNGFTDGVLRAGTLASETALVSVLEANGFAFVKRHARMTRPLTGDERPPTGFDIRPVRPDELPRFHEVLEAAFADAPDFEPTTYEDWRTWIDSLVSTSWDEWFVALSGGEIVGVLQSADQAVERGEGWIKNLAVLRGHRKTGIGGALLRTAFAAYAAKGRTSAGLGVDLTNPTGAYQLYTGVGMTVVFAADVYERPLGG
ncbi:GNAT family N-acetyltransferase [Dactylosporangium cerinum]|uniref:GNAT family N-acetyltransferase n=1 Tax=Dactylosporangium cerinum TaxID=1434730 RepID=A0ABV9VUG8_9ACTN